MQRVPEPNIDQNFFSIFGAGIKNGVFLYLFIHSENLKFFKIDLLFTNFDNNPTLKIVFIQNFMFELFKK